MEFSKRICCSFQKNKLFKLIESVDEREIINLIESNPTKVGIIYDKNILNNFLKEENLFYCPDPKGIEKARNVIYEYYEGKISIDHIILTSGTSEAYSYIFKILCDPLDNILIPLPGYPLFDYLASLEMVKTKSYRLEYIHEKGWKIDFDSLLSSMDDKTKAIVVINPNNPTGSYISEREKEKIVEIAKENNLAIISDEVFFEFNLDGKEYPSFIGNRECLTFVLSGISKILALPQMKLSWILISGEERVTKEALNRLELVADTFLSVSIPIQNALGNFFKYGEKIRSCLFERIRANYLLIQDYFTNTPIRVLKTAGGWSTILEVPKIMREDEWIKKLLLGKKCLLYPGYFFDFENEAFLILSLLIPPKDFAYGVESIFQVFLENQ